MKNQWWKHFGKISGGLFIIGLLLFQMSDYGSIGLYVAGGIIGLAIIITVIYFAMKQNSDEAI